MAWLLLVAMLGWQQVGFWREGRLDSDVFALLPGSADPALQAATDALAEAASQQVVVLLRGGDWAATRAAAQAFLTHLREDGLLQPESTDAAKAIAALGVMAPYRRGLITEAQLRRLQATSPDTLADEALRRLYAPGASSGLLPWAEDPLDLWGEAWQARAGDIRRRDGLLSVPDSAGDWVLLRLRYSRPSFNLDGEPHLQRRLQAALDAATAASGMPVRMLRAGVPLHAEAAAVRAHQEISLIGLGSMAAVLLLVWLSFRSLRPLFMVALSLLVGVLCGLAATRLVFGQVHLLTLVFGATLIGVAEDYGIHYFASRQGQPGVPPRTLLRQLAPALLLALATSLLAYLALGIAPMPGLRQMALFSVAGLTGAFATVLLWFPWLDAGRPRQSPFARAIAESLHRWPRWPAGRRGWMLLALLLLPAAGGWLQLRSEDGLRALQASPPDLLADEREISQRLGLPSPAQFYLLRAADPQTLLQLEEALAGRLQAGVDEGHLRGWRAVSQLVPSIARQQRNERIVRELETALFERIRQRIGQAPGAPAPQGFWLLPEVALAAAPGEALRSQWLGRHDGAWVSLVLLEGLGQEGLARAAAAADGLEGVRWVDRSADFSAVLSRYRVLMQWLLLVGYAAVALSLWLRFRRKAWRVLAPTVLAAAISLGLLGWFGVPLQLFGVLAQLLLLGVGVDYGIFLVEHEDDPPAWLAVCLGAASTWLAFGLLALSATPALHGFGLTLLLGIGLVWLLSPCFRPAGLRTDTAPTLKGMPS
ncbi:hypothetical protein F0415_00130 [Arenimonas fontis]|uniref:Membrane transport protein MMPL domain-containing protein n=1 Tax=Arenimonas fontis TaxID=2608255 RepID=A0A5B2ZE63_9GAMM|nr:hypothetical protein F0415_00130 [Arenimonas fontis]